MPASAQNQLAKIIDAQEQQILQDWFAMLKQSESAQGGRLKEAELQAQCRSLLSHLQAALEEAGVDAHAGAYDSIRAVLSEISRSRAIQGFSSGETARFVFSLKKSIFNAVRASEKDASSAADRVWESSLLLDELGLYTMEVYQKNREEVIARQQSEISELSTPVVKLWEGVLALPLIGTLDSARTQVVMENLLQSIVDYGAEIAIIDITGVPTVDTLVAQHLLKTVAAARLMGADCIVSGIRPQIAQTMVHLGVDLDVVTKSSLADAFAVALRRTGRAVVDTAAANSLSSGT